MVNDVDFAVNTINRVLLENALPEISREDYRRLFGFPVRDYYERIGFDFSSHRFEVVGTRFIEIYNSGAKDLDLFEGVPELMSGLRSSGKRHAILSAGQQSHLDEMLDHFKLSDHFDHICGIDNHYAASKVDRGKELMKLWNVDLKETVMVGDTDHDLEVAKALGIEIILVADGHQSYERLSSLHDKVLETRFPARAVGDLFMSKA